MVVLSICDNGDVLSALKIVKTVIMIIKIAVPIMLIISLMLNYADAMKSHDDTALSKANKAAVSKTIAAVLVFFIPTFVNLIAGVADPNNKTYLSCLEHANTESISEAYRLVAEKDLDKARETLTRSDFQIAQASARKVKTEKDKQELEEELNELEGYIVIREGLYALAKDFNREGYIKLKEDIEAIKDDKIKQKLKDEMVEALGGKGSLVQYIQDPYDALYTNIKNFSGTTLKTVLEKNGSSVEKLNLQIQQAVEAVGVGTREAPVAAAFTLIETLANYGYRINYDWGGKWYKLGVDGNFGSRITPQYCDSHPNPDRCKTQLIWKGFDCSGFVNWALIQGFQDTSITTQTTTTGSSIPLAGKTTAVCDIGDVVVNDKHITLVAGIDEENKRYLIAESTGGGVKLSYYAFNNSAYYCRKIKYSN